MPAQTPLRAKHSPYYEIRRSPIQGRGVFATRNVRKGTRMGEYFGEEISHEEADKRYDDRNGRHHTFLFVLDDDTVVDARHGGSDAKYINHSCDPNSESVIEDGRIWIESIRPIKQDDELTYDYRFEWQDEYEPEDIRYYACRCGSAKCRGTIVRVPVYLRPTIKKWLAGEDVPKPRKPKKGAKTSVKKRAVKRSAKRATSTKRSVKKAAKKRRVAR